MWNLEKWYRWTYLQGRNRDADVENRHVVTVGTGEGETNWESSVQSLSHSDSMWPHEPQPARPPCPSPTPGVHPNPCPLSQWCHPTISSSVVPFSSCPQSFPVSASFPVSQFFASGGQRIGASASASVLPMSIQGWYTLGWTGWISLQSKGLSRVFLFMRNLICGLQTSVWGR